MTCRTDKQRWLSSRPQPWRDEPLVTPIELATLMWHYGGAAGVLHHLEVHHPTVSLTRRKAACMVYAHTAYYEMQEKDYEVGWILRNDFPHYKTYGGDQHRNSPIVRHS